MNSKNILNSMKSLIDQKHCLMCKYFIKSSIPKDKGSCLKLKTYPAYKNSNISCNGNNFIVGGNNVSVYNLLLKENYINTIVNDNSKQ